MNDSHCPHCGRCAHCGQPKPPIHIGVIPYSPTTNPMPWQPISPTHYPLTIGDGVAPLTIGDGDAIPLTFGQTPFNSTGCNGGILPGNTWTGTTLSSRAWS
jgi:hypothetical protein